MLFKVWSKLNAAAAAVATAVILTACGGGAEADAASQQQALQRPHAQAAAVHTSAVTATDAATQLLDFGEGSLPGWFPGHKSSQTYGPFLFRYYPETQVYLGVIVSAAPGYVVGDVYVVGPPFGNTLANPLNAGPLTKYVTPVDPAAGGSSLVVSAATNSARNATYALSGGVFAGTGEAGWNGQTADDKLEMEVIWATSGTIKRAHFWFFDTPSTIKYFGCDGGKSIPCTGVAYDPQTQKLTFTNVVWNQVDADLSGSVADKPVSGGEHLTVNGSIDAK